MIIVGRSRSLNPKPASSSSGGDGGSDTCHAVHAPKLSVSIDSDAAFKPYEKAIEILPLVDCSDVNAAFEAHALFKLGLDAMGWDPEESYPPDEMVDVLSAVGAFTKASNLGLAKASLALATIYRNGYPEDGVDHDVVKSEQLYRKAINQGSLNAMFFLANLYLLGPTKTYDEDKGIELLKKAAHAGFVPACKMLGRIYKDQKRDWQQAAFWYTKAADQGDAGAQNQLGIMYMQGDYALVPFERLQELRKHPENFDIPFKDKDKAARWFGKMAQNCEDWSTSEVHYFMDKLGLRTIASIRTHI